MIDIIAPVLFLLVIFGFWYLKREDAGKTLGLLKENKEHKHAEEALRESREELAEIFAMSLDLICIADINTATFLKINPAFTRILGYSEQELLNRPFLDFIHPDDVAPTIATINGMLQKGEKVIDFLNRYRCKDGTYRWLSWVSHPIPKRGVTFAVAHDITERKTAEERIRQSERRFRQNFESAPVGMAIIDTQRRFLEVNSQICKILGYHPEEMVGRSFNSFTHPDDAEGGRERWRQLLDGEVEFNRSEKRYLHKDGRVLWVIVSNTLIRDDKGKPLYFLSHLMDITDQKAAQAEKMKLEVQLQQSQKMEAVGTLAGGMAHDFNNLLMGIQGRASLLSLELEPYHPHLEHIKAIEEYVRSATNITRQLLGFARGGKYEVRPVDMNELVLTSSALFGRTKKEIQIHTKCRKSPLVVEADRGQIEQVLLNIYVNAWQAMPPHGGDLYLETNTVILDEAFCKSHQAEPGCYVKVSITDTGIGMDETTRLQIFDPFFTTKEKGRGTGLGLASAYGIVKNHGGMITVYSEIGHGTTFNMYLPGSGKEPLKEVTLEESLIKGSATLLLVDDEEMIIDVGRAMLERLGYRVVVARGGQEAIETIMDRGAEIDLVILDLIMPGMDGGMTFDRIREIKSGMPVLLSSGYALNGHAHDIMARGCNGFIQKPYNISVLSNKVRSMLDERKN